MSALNEAIAEYHAVRKANALGLTVAQVRTLDALERNGAELEVENTPTGLYVDIAEYGPERWAWFGVLVHPDGSLDYRRRWA
jgi:hypothetical protein